MLCVCVCVVGRKEGNGHSICITDVSILDESGRWYTTKKRFKRLLFGTEICFPLQERASLSSLLLQDALFFCDAWNSVKKDPNLDDDGCPLLSL